MTVIGTIKPPTTNSRNKMEVDSEESSSTLILSNQTSDTEATQPYTSPSATLSLSSSFDLNRNSYCDVVKNGRTSIMDIDDDDDGGDDDVEEEKEEKMPQTITEREEEEHREFQFNIQNDPNLHSIINDNLQSSDSETGAFGERTMTTTTNSSVHSHNTMGEHELTSDYILSKLYNYMKISEMSKYGISVFEMTFSSYLPYLNESHLIKLATSYWCNGQHFKCMISHRGDRIKPLIPNEESNEWFSSFCNQKHQISQQNNGRLQLKITSDLLDAAMQSGASVDKIEAMLLQKRMDNGMCGHHHHQKSENGKCKQQQQQISNKCRSSKKKFYQTTDERNFYLRNLKHRFWNHEVLVRVFIQNGWLSSKLAEVALKTFINTIYHRVLQSKASMKKNKNITENPRVGGVKFSETFLHSFFVSYFCLDDIPKMYKQEIQAMARNNGKCYASQISEETLRRWCELIELLASRGANVAEAEFKKVIPLQYALQLGRNTYKIISSSHKMKNEYLLPTQYHQEGVCVPDDIWDVLVSYL